MPTEPGAPLGPETSAIISSAGATLAIANGELSISIPAGVVAAPTEFTITPIANTARGAVGGAFRLGPEGATFAPSVTLTFKGPAQYPFGTSIADVGVAYRDGKGFWHRVEPATRDAVANTVSVTTDHFSDWALTWQSGIPAAEGPIRLVQTVGIPFTAHGRATVYFRDDDAAFTSYVLTGTLTVPATITVGNDVCIPDQTTKSWANIAEIDKRKGVFRWGTGVYWTLTCTAPGGAASTQIMPASLDTLGINLGQCTGAYAPGQFAEMDFMQGEYTSDCGLAGTVRGTWDLRGYQILVDPLSGLMTTEAGGAATFQIVLNKAPSADVTVALSTSLPEGTVSPSSVTFSPNDWSTPQVVTVTGANDFVVDGDAAYTVVTAPAVSADPRYQGVDPADVQVTNLDDDIAGFTMEPAPGLITTEAGGAATFQLSLTSQPVADVVVSLASSDTTEGTVSPASLSFTTANWSVPRSVTVTGVNDFVADGPIAYSIQATGSSADPNYQGRTGSVAATNADDDVAGLAPTPAAGLVTTEAGGTATYRLALTSQPLADVVVTLSSSDATEGTVSPASITFTASNWNVVQTVTVTGADDFVADGGVAYSVQMSTTSADPGYAGRTGAVSVTNLDDDAAGLVASPASGLVTTEAGATATFQVTLSSQPLADVVVALSSSDLAEGTVAPASLTFTPASWNVAQAVIVTGVDDAVVDGAIAYTVQTAAASADPGYAGLGGVVSVTNVDDDTAGVAIGAPSGASTSEAGTSVTFTVVLTSQPTADVVVPLSSSDPTEGTVSPAALLFTAANWNVAQTVTVTGVDDAVADGAQTYVVGLGPATSVDRSYQGREAAGVTLINSDDDVAGITVSTPTGSSTSEAGTSVTFTVVLTSEPTADVTLPLSSSDTTEGTVSPASVTFTSANWNVAQTVTVTGVDDLVADGDQAYTVVIGGSTSLDAGYQGKDPNDLPFTNRDDDAAAITVSAPSGTSTSEAGASVTFTVVLASQPAADVTIPLSSSDPAEGTVSPAALVFTAVSWNVAQTVTVTGVDDLVADGNHSYVVAIGPAASLDASYQGKDPADLTLTNADDDAVGIIVSPPSGLSTWEAGTSVTFTVVLASQPTADVAIPLSSSDAAEGTVSPASLVFTPASWNLAQTVTVTGADDLVADGDQVYTVVIGPSTGLDPAYQGIDAPDFLLTNVDDDAAGLVATPPSGLATTEAGGTATFQLTLSSQPTADVVVVLSSSDATEGAVTPASVTFTAADWNLPRTVTVTGVDDPVADGAIAYSIELSATSADAGYAGRTRTVSATNGDDDTAGMVASPSAGLVTTEAGGTATFQLTLSSQPTAEVVIALSSSDTTEGTATPASVTFTPADWNLAHTVTVKGVDDPVADGPIAYSIQLTAASSDPGYDGRTGSVSATNGDDDAAGIALGAPSAASTSESGTSLTFTVVLTSQPTADVTLPLSSSDTSEGVVSPASLVFTAANWNLVQTVTVTGVDDLVADGPRTYVAGIGPAASLDAAYQGKDPADLTFTNADDDVAGLVATPSSGLVTTEAGGTATFQLLLSSQPTADVVVALSSSDTTEGTVSPASVTFTPANWNLAQPVAVTGVDDSVADGAIAYSIQMAATSADAGYGGRIGTVPVTNADDDAAGISVSPPSGIATLEAGTSVTFTVVLASQPLSDVVVALSSSDTAEGAVSPASVTFTPADWNLAQTVTVTGVDDLVDDGDRPYTVLVGASTSADPAYQGIDPPDLLLTNVDDDVAGLVATPPSGLMTTEAGGTATFQLALTSQPTADVVVALSSSDTTEGTVAPATVTFTAADWNVPQTVTVTGVDDLDVDGDVPYSISMAGTSSDARYEAATGAVSVTNADDDAAGVALAR